MNERVTYLGVVQRIDSADNPTGDMTAMEHPTAAAAEKWCRTWVLGRSGMMAQAVLRVTPGAVECVSRGGIVRPTEKWDDIERAVVETARPMIGGIRDRWRTDGGEHQEAERPKRAAGAFAAGVAAAAEWARRDIEASAGTLGFGPGADLDNPPEPVAGTMWFPPEGGTHVQQALAEPIAAHVRHQMPPSSLPSGIGGVVIGVVDTGCKVNHWTLTDSDVSVIDCTGRGGHELDQNGHGTAVVSQIVGRMGGGARFGGAHGARVVVAGVLDSHTGVGLDSWIARGVRACVRAGCRVINASLGGDSPMPLTEVAIGEATKAGVLVVAAAGNGGRARGGASYPGRYDEVLCVSAVDDSDGYPEFSQRGEGEEVSARGVAQVVAVGMSQVGTMSGTSMAAPHVTSAVARILAAGDELYGQEMDATRAGELVMEAAEPGAPDVGGSGAMPFVMLCEPAESLLTVPGPVEPPKPPPPAWELVISADDRVTLGTLAGIVKALAVVSEVGGRIRITPAG